jgi:hypothetical protein
MLAVLWVPDIEALINAFSDPDLVVASRAANKSVEAVAATSGEDLTTVWSAMAIGYWLCRNANELNIETLAADLSNMGIGEHKDVERSNRILRRLIEAFTPAFNRRWFVSQLMPTFRKLEYACDLRVYSDNAPSTRTLVPVCTIRVECDEGEPFVFQCMPADLDVLIEELTHAKEQLGDSVSTTRS